MSILQHNVIGVTGAFGSGKSLYAVELAIKFAQKSRKHLVFNFPVNAKAVRSYARSRGYRWVAKCARITSIEVWERVDLIFKYRDSVFVYDEAGIFTNSRNWKRLGDYFLKCLFQVRKLNIHLLIIFQFQEQVDKQIRQVIQHWICCRSWATYSYRLKAPRIYARMCYHYDCEKFFRLQQDVRARGNIILPWFWAEVTYFRYLPICKLFAILENGFHEIIDCLVFLFSRGTSRHRFVRRRSREEGLFRIFSSTKLVGDSGSKRLESQLAPFITEVEYDALHPPLTRTSPSYFDGDVPLFNVTHN